MVHFSECSRVAANYNTETQIEMRGRTIEHFPGQPLPRADPLAHRERDEKLAPLDPVAARPEKPLRPKDVPVGPRVAREQGLGHESLSDAFQFSSIITHELGIHFSLRICSTLWGIPSFAMFCRAFLPCSTGRRANTVASVQPNW